MRRLCPERLNIELLRMLQQLVTQLACKVTIQTADDYDDALAVVHDFPAMTIEEIRLAFAWIRQGKLGGKWYERFKAPELRECLSAYEEMRADRHLEHRHKAADNYPRIDGGNAGGNAGDIIKRLIADLGDNEPKPYTDKWLMGKERKMTRQERERLQERDCQRRNQQLNNEQ